MRTPLICGYALPSQSCSQIGEGAEESLAIYLPTSPGPTHHNIKKGSMSAIFNRLQTYHSGSRPRQTYRNLQTEAARETCFDLFA
jgi:hypothetical protein